MNGRATIDAPLAQSARPEPVTFGIPLVSRRVARDWGSVEKLLTATLRSIFNNDDPDLRIIVACHEVPSVPGLDDPRVTVVPVAFDIPRFRWEMEIDRMRKLEVIGAQLRAQGGGLLHILDADDLVAQGLTRALRAATSKAVVVHRGYRLDARRGQYQLLNKIWGKCGSCIAVRWDSLELPETPLTGSGPLYHEFCENRHYALPAFFSRLQWSCQFLQDPLVTYVINHGSNQSEVITRDNLRWRLYFKILRWHPWTPALDRVFGVDPQSRQAAIYDGKGAFSTEART